MDDVLHEIARHNGTTRPFTARSLAKRAGKIRVFPVGIGSALEKAVRQGLLDVHSEGSRRRGRAYSFTPQGTERLRRLVADARSSMSKNDEAPRAGSSGHP